MAYFGWFGEQEHREFNYKPIYYNQEEEERRRMFGNVDGSKEASQKGKDGEKEYTPGVYIQGSFRNGNYARRKGATKAQSIIGMVGLMLVVAVLIYIAKFYTLL